ncbi:MAG TPA: DUF2914 domain-containing protein [Thermoanaerobaculia bacterium]|nr:DUF2914 domain-containing protein [Thermoanaerobaculia bacterium]
MAVRERVLTTYQRVRPWVPAVFFIGGFTWDALTLGQKIQSVDLFILLVYLTGAAAILVALGRGVQFRGSQYLNAVLQFFFGGIFSALFIFYFLSSSDLPGYLIVLGLAGLLIGNEFLHSRYSELTLAWALFTMSAAMFFNFALAHAFHSISTFWFYLGTLIAVLLVLALRQVSRHESASIAPSMIVAAALLAVHALNFIPPVPLVKKEMLVAHDVHKRDGAYDALVESPGWRIWRSSSTVFHRAGSERVYCFTSVFVPNGIRTTIRHRWLLYDAKAGEWRTTSVIPFTISGGRSGGYRGLTYKQNVAPGEWRVIAESESGARIGIVDFDVVSGEPSKLRKLRL